MPDLTFSSSDYFEILFNDAKQNCVLLLNEKGIIADANPAFVNCFGYSKDD